jgi:MoaA/NifB/PqqE/SkfB family radical SAM enzyme
LRRIVNLEIHVAHGCNLACESCAHYSNHGHKGVIDLAAAERWMAPWAGRLLPAQFSLVGGEPTIHPDLAGFVRLTRRMWPETPLRLVTNGFFLNRHPELPQALKEAAPAWIDLSIHHDSPEYRARIAPVLDFARGWKERHGLDIRFNESFRHWTRRYHGFGAAMKPFTDGDPRRSWEICPARICPQILDGRIYKCALMAYLPMQQARFGLGPEWAPYLAYRPLEPRCSDAALEAFFAREEEPVCSMCPAERRDLALPNPLPSARAGAPIREKAGPAAASPAG